MAEGQFVAYYRVSTDQQGRSGLGLEAQQRAVEDFLNGGNWRLVDTYTEVESGRKAARPQLTKALAACRARRATLVIAKLDRLTRDTKFLLNLVDAGEPSEEDRASALSARREKAARLARDLAPILEDIRANGITSLNGIAAELTRRGIPTPRGSRAWSAVQVQRMSAGRDN